jgi:hypothetical protein
LIYIIRYEIINHGQERGGQKTNQQGRKKMTEFYASDIKKNYQYISKILKKKYKNVTVEKDYRIGATDGGHLILAIEYHHDKNGERITETYMYGL